MFTYTELTTGTTVNNGDVIHRYSISGNIVEESAKICYVDNDPQTTLHGVNSITVSGGPYTVYTFSSDTVILQNAPASSGATTSTASDSPVSGYYRSLAALIAAIKIEGGETHGYGIGSALPYSVMKALADNPDDVLVFKTDYKGYHYEFTIQVGEDVKDKITPEIPWYGPYWLAKYFYKTTVIEKLPDYS